VLLVGIGITILLGDRVGVTLERVAPLETARITSRITMQFSESMDRASVESRFRTEPEIAGAFSWSGDTLIYQPEEVMPPGQEVTVVLEPGAVSENGREVLSEVRYSFTVRSPRVAYLFPADDPPQNIWVVDPANPDSAQQVTFSPTGIYNFAVSPDGTKIAFAESNSNTGTYDIKLFDLETQALEQLTNCIDASCTTPVWRPDGSMIVYERVDFNSDLQGVGSSPTRLWVLDLTSRPVQTRPLFSDLQILGYDAEWSADGSRIALYDRSSASILIYDFTDGNIAVIESTGGSAGGLSPDGTKIVYEEIPSAIEEFGVTPYLTMIDLPTNEQTMISTPEEGYSDSAPLWSPDGNLLAFARRDTTFAPGEQVYLYDVRTGEERRLTDDPRYVNGFFRWDPTGMQLVVQRFPMLDENFQLDNSGRTEIWTLDVTDGTLTQVAVNGFIPTWLP
jgi:Tol biopolymer transport system component